MLKYGTNANKTSGDARIFNSRLAPYGKALAAWSLAAALLTLTTAAQAASKPDQLIRKHLMERENKTAESISSVEPLNSEPLEKVLSVKVWKVEYTREGKKGNNLAFMAVKDGEVLRLRKFDDPAVRDNFVKLLRDDFRVNSKEDAALLVSATLALHFGFPFSEPEKTVEEMQYQARDGEYFFIDGERFSDATGYWIATDGDGRITKYEYSWELPVELPTED